MFHLRKRKHLRRQFVAVCAVFTVCAWSNYIFKQFGWMHLPFLNDGQTNDVNILTAKYSAETLNEDEIKHYPTAKYSRTKPPFYPLNGTGKTVNISADYDNERLEDFCETEKNLVAIVPVFSAPGNFERRKAMRETVGKVCAQLECKMFFIVGISLNKVIYDKVKEEYLTANDILMVNKVDSYRDLNNKVVAMLEWLIDFCQSPKYVIHIIDDCYPNLKLIIGQLDSIERDTFILGVNKTRSRPFRNPSSKWYMSMDEYPYTRFPHYILGVMYAFLNNESVILRGKVHAVEYCWVEDVWFTGYVRQAVGFELIRLTKRFWENFKPTDDLTSIWEEKSGIHNITSSDFYVIYDHTTL